MIKVITDPYVKCFVDRKFTKFGNIDFFYRYVHFMYNVFSAEFFGHNMSVHVPFIWWWSIASDYSKLAVQTHLDLFFSGPLHISYTSWWTLLQFVISVHEVDVLWNMFNYVIQKSGSNDGIFYCILWLLHIFCNFSILTKLTSVHQHMAVHQESFFM